MYSSQYEFRQEKTWRCLWKIIHISSISLDNNRIAPALCLDLFRVFDTIDNLIMLEKLYIIGFRKPFYTAFENLFMKKYQVVNINVKTKDPIQMNFGVLQGSVLGPLLFNVYMKEIAHLKLKSKLFQYVDDTALILQHEEYNISAIIFQDDVAEILS